MFSLSESIGLVTAETLRVDDARVLITEFEEDPKFASTIWTQFKDKNCEIGLVLVKEGHSDEGTLRLRVLDVDGQTRKQRWWKVESMARAEGMQVVPIYWDGPADRIPKKFKTYEPDKPNRVVLVRLAEMGPWARMELEKIAPEIKGD